MSMFDYCAATEDYLEVDDCSKADGCLKVGDCLKVDCGLKVKECLQNRLELVTNSVEASVRGSLTYHGSQKSPKVQTSHAFRLLSVDHTCHRLLKGHAPRTGLAFLPLYPYLE